MSVFGIIRIGPHFPAFGLNTERYGVSRIRTEYGEILGVSPYSVGMQENADQNNSKYGDFWRSECYILNTTDLQNCIIFYKKYKIDPLT